MSGAKLVIEQLTPSLEVEVFEYRLTVGNAPGANGKDAVITAQSIGDAIAAAEDKTELVDGDGIAVSNSEDGDILVEWTYGSLKAQLLAYLTTAFNLLYQPLSTALSKITEGGGLPLWDGAAWPGGGGGGSWETVETRALSGNLVELFDVGTDDNIRFVWDGVAIGGTQIPHLACSIDNGVTYPNTHIYGGFYHRSDGGHAASPTSGGQNYFLLLASYSTAGKEIEGIIRLKRIAQVGSTTDMAGELNHMRTNTINENNAPAGNFNTAGVVNKIKIDCNAVLSSGNIILQKRTF